MQNHSHKTFKIMFYSIFGITFLIIAIYFALIGWAGVTAYNAVQDNNGSAAKTLGHMYRDFKQASEEE